MSNNKKLNRNESEMEFPLVRCVHQSVKNPPIADLEEQIKKKIMYV